MEYVYAALLLDHADAEITRSSLSRTLEGAGITPEESRVRAFLDELEDVDIREAVGEATDGDQPGPYVYAGLLLNEGGTEITDTTLTDTLEAAGIAVDPYRVTSLTTALEDVDIEAAVADASPADTETSASPAEPAPPGIPDSIPGAPAVSVAYDDLRESEQIGAGGNADVTKAVLDSPHGDVPLAIKKPRLAGTLRTDEVDRLLTEAETWAKLDDHEHIVSVVAYDSEPLPWIAMEYMDGGHLGDRAGSMDAGQALWTALSITRAIRHAHRQGVAHLDLKPENVLFRTVDGDWDVPKVADWGLSKHLLEHSGSVDGISVAYAAPEQFDDDYGHADDITDIYQLGAVCYELFTGRPPFEGQPFRVVDDIKTTQPTPPSEVADVPDGVDELLLTALAKEKADRYEDIIYFRDGLRELLDGSG
jgi:ribosomal protein L12E/L44/L45/RPP1/RPP2/tRNA A-37 threonylcarbamoyl transferase component Bud32